MVACVSGRQASDARAMVAIGTITYLGSHGAELLRAGWTEAEVDPALEDWARRIHEFGREADTTDLRRRRIRIEDKGPIVAFHWRGAPDEEAARAAIDAVAARAEAAGLRTHWGRKVLEVRPPVKIDKGAGITKLLDRCRTRQRPVRRRRRHRSRRVPDADADGRGRPPATGDQGRRALRRGAIGDHLASGYRGGWNERRGAAAVAARCRLMRFPEFLRTTVLICAAAATVLGAVTLAGASGADDDLLLPFAAGWWAFAGGDRRVARAPGEHVLADRGAARRRAHADDAARARPRADRAQPAVAAAGGDGGRRCAGVPRAAGTGRRHRLRDHLGAGMAPAGLGRDRDRGARRRALLRGADVSAAADPAGPHAGLPLEPVRAQRPFGPAPGAPRT